MTASYPPALKASDDPATAPNEKAFVGGGGSPGFNIDSIYGASTSGDYFASTVGQFTDLGVTPATSNGDLVRQWNGQKTLGTNINVIQNTSGDRPELAADGTYSQSTYFAPSAVKWISQETFNDPIKLWGARFRLDVVGSIGSAFNAFSFLSEDFNSLVKGVGVALNRRLRVAGNTTSDAGSTVIADTDWHTIVAYHDGTTFYGFLDDMSTPEVTFATTLSNLQNARTGHINSTSGGHVHKMMCHDTWDAATPADLASWLES